MILSLYHSIVLYNIVNNNVNNNINIHHLIVPKEGTREVILTLIPLFLVH